MEEFDKHTMDMLHQFIETCVYKAIDEKLANGWGSWRQSVVENFKDVKEREKDLKAGQTEIKISLEVLKNEVKIKSGMWGLIGGALPILLGLALWLLKSVIIP